MRRGVLVYGIAAAICVPVGGPFCPFCRRMEEARAEVKEVADELTSAIRSETPLRSKFASWFLICQTTMFLTVGLIFTLATVSALDTTKSFLSYHSDEYLARMLTVGLRMGIATGIFLILLSVLGCWATCRLSVVGLTVFVATLGIAIVLQVAGSALIFEYGSQINNIPVTEINIALNKTTGTATISGKTALDLEQEAFKSFLNITYAECCVHKHWEEGSTQWRHCKIAENMAGSCDQGKQEFKQALANRLSDLARPLARAYLVFAVWQLLVFVLASCVLWRVAHMSKVQYKMGKGFSRIEIK